MKIYSVTSPEEWEAFKLQISWGSDTEGFMESSAWEISVSIVLTRHGFNNTLRHLQLPHTDFLSIGSYLSPARNPPSLCSPLHSPAHSGQIIVPSLLIVLPSLPPSPPTHSRTGQVIITFSLNSYYVPPASSRKPHNKNHLILLRRSTILIL